MKPDKGKSSPGAAPGLTLEDQKKAEEILDRLRASTGATNDSSLADALGLGVSSISTARTRGMIPPSWIVNASVRHGVSADFLITGKRPDNPPATPPPAPPSAPLPAPPATPSVAPSIERVGAQASGRSPTSGISQASGLFGPSEPSGPASPKETFRARVEESSSQADKGPGREAGFSGSQAHPAADSPPGESAADHPGRAPVRGPSDSGKISKPFKARDLEDTETLPDFAFQGVVPRRGGSFSERELELLPEETFRELWESFRTRSPAMKGWVRIETIGRFPEFIKWLRSGND